MPVEGCYGGPSPFRLPVFHEFQRTEEFALQAIHDLAALLIVVDAGIGHRCTQILPLFDLKLAPGHLDVTRAGPVDKHDFLAVDGGQVLHGTNGYEQVFAAGSGEQQVQLVVEFRGHAALFPPHFTGVSMKLYNRFNGTPFHLFDTRVCVGIRCNIPEFQLDPSEAVNVLLVLGRMIHNRIYAFIRIEVIASAGGLDLLRVGVSPFEQQVRHIMAKHGNVHFIACANAVRNLREQGVSVNIITDIDTSHTAVERIVERLQDGWNYVKIEDLTEL